MSNNTSAIDALVLPQGINQNSLRLWNNELKTIHNKLIANNLGLHLVCGAEKNSLGTFETTNKREVKFVFKDQRSFYRFSKRPRLLELANQYIEGQVDIHGNIDETLNICDQLSDQAQSPFEAIRGRFINAITAHRLLRSITSSSRGHYGLSSELYRLFLDPYMQYTCAYYSSEECNLASAQINKFNLIQEWTGPLRNKRHIDIGCGWGGLLAYFSSQFGTQSIGITDTPEQGWYATKTYGVNTIVGDFTALDQMSDSFDLVTVVGMIEHLTPYLQSQLFNVVARKLSRGGSMYLQCIVKSPHWIGGDGSRFLQQHVFPGYFIDHPESVESRLATAGFEIVIKCDHSEHYGRTCKAWLDALTQNEQQIIHLLGQREYRIFYAYLAGAMRVFSSGRGSLHRYLLRPKNA